MLKAHEVRLYPTEEQALCFVRNIGCSRFVYNKTLAYCKDLYAKGEKKPSKFDLQKNFLLGLKKEFSWLKGSYSQSLQVSVHHVDDAYQNFFKKKSSFPKFKKKFVSSETISYPQGIKVDFKSSHIIIPKIGKVLAIFSRKFEGKIKTCTVSRKPSGKFFISILVDDGMPLPEKQEIKSETSVGLDLGLKDLYTTSEGIKVESPKFLRKQLKKLAKLQRRFSRKKKGSKNKEKARIKLARLHEKIANQRKDFLHKESSKLINNSKNQTIILEDLNVKGMQKNRRLSLSIADASWGEFIRQLAYKAEWIGKNVLFIDRFAPSSKTCFDCGSLNHNLKLSDRYWTCKACNSYHDRDINAAKNIKKFGIGKVNSEKDLKIIKQFSNAGPERSKEPAIAKAIDVIIPDIMMLEMLGTNLELVSNSENEICEAGKLFKNNLENNFLIEN